MGPLGTGLTLPRFSRSGISRILVILTFGALLLALATVPATAAVSDGTTTYQYEDDNPTPLESGTTYWQGWTVTFDATEILSSPDSASEQQRTFQIRRVTDDNQIGNQLASFIVDQSGQATFDVSSYTGTIAIVYGGEVVHVTGGVGYTSGTPDGTSPTVSNSAWSVIQQDLQTSLTKTTVYDKEHTTITITSDRSDFTVGVSSPDLSFAQLTQIFPNSTYAPNYAAQKNDSVLLLAGSDRVEATLNFTNITPGSYDFEFSVTDTTGYASPVITVSQPNQNARFETVQTTAYAGDPFTTTVACADCYLVVGNAKDNVIDLLRLQDQTGDGRVTLTINSRYAGIDTSGPGAPTGISGYSVGSDSVTVLRSSDKLTTGRTLGSVRSDLDIASNGRKSPLPPGNYELTISTTTHLRAHPPSDPSILRMRDTADVATVTLKQPRTNTIESFVGRPGFPRDLTLEDLPDRITQRDQVVSGDQLILRIDVSGLHGYLGVDENTGLSALRRNEDEGINLRIAGDGTEINPVKSRGQLLIDPSNQYVYVVLDTRELRGGQREVTPGEYTATFTLSGIASSQDEYSVYPPEDNWQGFPYLAPGDSVTVQTAFSLIEQSGSTTFTTFENGEVQVPDQSGAPVQGTSKLAPGSRFTIRAEADSSMGWTTDDIVTVDANGTWEATLDFSVASPDQSFTITAQRNDQEIASSSGTVVAASEFTTPVPPSETSSDSSSGGQSSQSANTDQSQSSENSGILSVIPGVSLFSGLVGKIVLGVAGVTVFLGMMITVFRLIRG